MTYQNSLEEEFGKEFLSDPVKLVNANGQEFMTLPSAKVKDILAFILKIEADAERRGYNEGYSHALNACKILIADQGAQGALHGVELLEKSLNTPQS